MERIHKLLGKLQEIYYKKEEKQVIDIDLMLDYTRVIYADLLDARTDILAKQGMGLHLKERQTPVMPPLTEEKEQRLSNDEPETIAGENVEENDIAEENNMDWETEAQEPVPELDHTDNQQEPLMNLEEEASITASIEEAAQSDEEEPADEADVAAFASEQIVATEPGTKAQIVINDDDYPSLSTDEKKDEEPPVFSEIHFELPEVKDKASESPKAGFVFKKHKDIRSFIGINDKYQFMNELFANNRTAYEESLDKLTGFETFEAAQDWLLHTALPQHNWSKEDETFQTLIQTAKKFFAA